MHRFSFIKYVQNVMFQFTHFFFKKKKTIFQLKKKKKKKKTHPTHTGTLSFGRLFFHLFKKKIDFLNFHQEFFLFFCANEDH
jgi:hypothetical protein